MSFSAHLEGTSLADLLQVLSTSKQSGVATIIHSGAAGKLVFRRGRVVYASSDTRSRLGYSLVQRGVISKDDLQHALALQRQRKDGMPLASVLLKLGLVSPEQLEKETRRHIMGVFADILRWESGVVYFAPQEIPDSLTVLQHGLAVETLLIESAVNEDHASLEAETADDMLDRELCELWMDSRP